MTWEMVARPKGKKTMGYTLKYKADRTLQRYKAMVVAKARPMEWIIKRPLQSMLNKVRILLSLAAHFNQDLEQFDVKNAFLHGDLKEEGFIEPPWV